ncbi:MAG: isochorismatase family protein [Dehalococcoidia bacterium]
MVQYEKRTALIVVDVQNDFADPSGSLYVSGGDAIIDRVNEEIRLAREAGALVVYTQDWHPHHTPHFQQDGGIWPVHCVRDTWGSEFHPRLDTAEGDVLRKGTEGEDGYSAFTVRDPESGEAEATALEAMLRTRGAELVVVVGLAADVCVKDTALDAVRLGFQTMVLAEATRGVDLQPGDTQRAYEELRAAGVQVDERSAR